MLLVQVTVNADVAQVVEALTALDPVLRPATALQVKSDF